MRRTLLPPLTLLACVLLPAAAAAAPVKVVWRDWDTGLKQARTTSRPVLVDVVTDWCGWCKRMDADVYSRSDVQDYLTRRFVTVRLNAESPSPATYQGKAYNGRSLAQRFQVSGYPTTIFLRSGGDHLVNVPGYIRADRFLLLLQYIADGYMDRGVQFDDFVAQTSGAGASGKP